MSIFQPSNQIRLTNVSIVRLKKSGKRFELACYKNKIMEWRTGVETDLDNVLQTPTIFINVSKGQVAAKEDLEKAFPKAANEQEIVQEILKKGEVQVSTLERNNQLQHIQKDIVTIITEKTVNPETQRPYPASMIEKAVDELHYSTSTGKSAKQQALEIIKLLQEKKTLAIARAQMRVQITLPGKEAKKMKEKLMPLLSKVETEDYNGNECQMECLIEPGQFRVIGDLLQAETRGRARLDLLSLSETADFEERL